MSLENIRIGHLEHLESPWGNAGGVVKSVEEVEAMARTGVGWIEAGSYTLEPRQGNQKDADGNVLIDPSTNAPLVVYRHDPATGETFNSLGMPNQGMDELVGQIPEMVRIARSYKKELVINVAPVTDDPASETHELVSRAYEAGAPAVLVNGGCPNVVTEDGGRHELLSHNALMFGTVLCRLSDVTAQYHKVFVRTSPFEGYDQAKVIYRRMGSAGTVSAVWTPNTWPGQRPVDENGDAVLGVPGGTGGKSGPATYEKAEKQLYMAREILDKSIDVVSSGGIMNGVSLYRRLLDAAAGAGTTFYFESQSGWEEDTDRLISQLYNQIEYQSSKSGRRPGAAGY